MKFSSYGAYVWNSTTQLSKFGSSWKSLASLLILITPKHYYLNFYMLEILFRRLRIPCSWKIICFCIFFAQVRNRRCCLVYKWMSNIIKIWSWRSGWNIAIYEMNTCVLKSVYRYFYAGFNFNNWVKKWRLDNDLI